MKRSQILLLYYYLAVDFGILHDWSDEECVNILKNCKEAIMSEGKEGKAIIIDVVINQEKDEHDVTTTKLLFDALMMVLLTGKERNKK